MNSAAESRDETMTGFNRHEPDFDVVHEVSEGLYTFVTRFLFQGAHPIHNRSVIIHVPAAAAGARGALAIINPAELRPEVKEQIERLEADLSATVRYLISPGDWHWMFIHQHVAAFPEATAYVPPGRIPSMQPNFAYRVIDVAADNPFPELEPHVVAMTCQGLLEFTKAEVGLPRHELVFHFPKARAITSGDVFYYHGVAELNERQKALDVKARVVDFHFAKWRMVRDPVALRRSLERITAWDFDRYISIHGAPSNMLESGAKEHIERVLEWAKSPPL